MFSAKTGSNYYTHAERSAIRARAASGEFDLHLEILRETADLVASLSDEEIWALVPPPELPRAYNVHFGQDCPEHGKAIHQAGGHYPWKLSADHPYKVICPVGGESYPSNDYAAERHGHAVPAYVAADAGRYVDHGDGWLSPTGERYFFVGYYNFWWIWRRTLVQGSEACAKLYLATGEKRYAHKAALVLARLSQVYPELDFNTQGVSDGKHPSGWPGRISDRIWENGLATALARTYDLIFEAVADNVALKEFIAARGITSFAEAVERNIFQVQVADIFAERIRGNKFELGTLSTLALVLQNDDPVKGATTRQMIDWLLGGGGDLEYTFFNGFDRDGIGGESAPGYSEIWNERFVEAAENLGRLGVDILQEPKWLRIAKGPAELKVLDRMALRIGDSGGGIRGSKRRLNADLLRFGVSRFQDPDAARWLLQLPAPTPTRPSPAGMAASPDDRLFGRGLPAAGALRQLAARASYPASPHSRVLGGYGLAILEHDDGHHQHAATLYFGGPAAWHQHWDRLNLGYFRDDREVLSELGYPTHWGPTAEYWIKNTPSHYSVMIDGYAQPQRLAGHLTAFATTAGLKLASADGQAAWSTHPLTAGSHDEKRPAPEVSAYQRTIALLDTGENSTVLIDVFLARGGSQHDYSFHGLGFGTLDHALPLLREQTRGTLAGEAVAYAADPGGDRVTAGYQFLKTPRWISPSDVSAFTWRNDNGLNQTTWFPRFSLKEIIVAEAIPPLGPAFPATLPYVFLRNEGPALTSLFVSATEVFTEAGKIAAVTRIAADQPAAGALEIELKSGRRWKVYLNESGHLANFGDGAVSSVRFAAVHRDGNSVRVGTVVGPGTFSMDRSTSPTVLKTQAWEVKAVDYRHGRVTLDRAFSLPPRQGSVVTLPKLATPQSYTIRGSDGADVSFGEVGLIAGRFAGGWDRASQSLIAAERVDGEYSQFNARSFVGMAVLDSDRRFVATILHVDRARRQFTLSDPESASRRLNSHDNPTYFYLSDFGPGTRVELTPVLDLATAGR